MPGGGYPFVAPNYGDTANQAVSGGFDQVFQALADRQKQQQAAVQFAGQTGFDPNKLAQGQQIAREFAGAPGFSPQNAGNVLSPQEADMWQQFQQFTGQGKQRYAAQTQDIQAQARQREATADWMTRRPAGPAGAQGGNNLTPEEWKALTDAAYSHPERFPADLLTARGPKAKFIAAEVMKNPDFDPTVGNVAYAGQKSGAMAGARLTEGGSSQVVARTSQSVKEQLGILQEASQNFPRTDIQAMNTPLIALDKQVYPEAQNWLTAVNSVRYEYATALARGNKPGEQDINDAKAALPDNITPHQLEAVIPLMGRLLDATVKGQMTPASAPKSSKAATKAGSDDMVRVVSPDGQSGKIPRSKLQQAIKRGFKQAK